MREGVYWYCDFLLAQGHSADVTSRAQQSLAWAGTLLLDAALCHLLLGRSSPPGSQQTQDHLQEAVVGVQRWGQALYVPRVLLARSSESRIRARFGQADKDLAEAYNLATRGGMRLQVIDCIIERSRLYFSQGQRPEAKEAHSSAMGLAVAVGTYCRKIELRRLAEEIVSSDLPRHASVEGIGSREMRARFSMADASCKRLDLYLDRANDERHVAPTNQTWVLIRVSRPVAGSRNTTSLG